MKSRTPDRPRKPYAKPVLKAVKIRPREVLGSTCNISANTAVTPCDFAVCSVE